LDNPVNTPAGSDVSWLLLSNSATYSLQMLSDFSLQVMQIGQSCEHASRQRCQLVVVQIPATAPHIHFKCSVTSAYRPPRLVNPVKTPAGSDVSWLLLKCLQQRHKFTSNAQ